MLKKNPVQLHDLETVLLLRIAALVRWGYRMDRFPTVLSCETVSMRTSMRTVALVAECGKMSASFSCQTWSGKV